MFRFAYHAAGGFAPFTLLCELPWRDLADDEDAKAALKREMEENPRFPAPRRSVDPNARPRRQLVMPPPIGGEVDEDGFSVEEVGALPTHTPGPRRNAGLTLVKLIALVKHRSNRWSIR